MSSRAAVTVRAAASLLAMMMSQVMTVAVVMTMRRQTCKPEVTQKTTAVVASRTVKRSLVRSQHSWAGDTGAGHP